MTFSLEIELLKKQKLVFSFENETTSEEKIKHTAYGPYINCRCNRFTVNCLILRINTPCTSGAKYKIVPHIVFRRVLSLFVVIVPKSVTIM